MRALRSFACEFVREFEQDIVIWERKVYVERPALCSDDGRIGRFRRWARQFYPEPTPIEE